MKSSSNIKNTVLGFAIVAMIGSLLLYRYFGSATDDLIRRTVRARNYVATTQAARLQGKETMKLFEATSERRDRLPDYLIPSESAVDAIRAIESIGETSGAAVEISSIRSSPATAEKLGQVMASVAVKGSWKSVMEAVELFETIQYQKSLNNLRLTLVDRGSEKDREKAASRWEADFDLVFPTIIKSH